MAGWDKARIGRALAVAAFLGLTAAPALADSVPLPRPRPHRVLHTGSIPALPPQALRARAQAPTAQAPATQAPAAQAAAAQPQSSPSPVSNPFAALLGKPGSTTALTPEQRSIIERVDTYLSTVQTLTGKFVQIGPDGSRSTGVFYLAKPGRVRFEYDSPNPTELVADGQSVVVRDRNLGTQDVYPLSQTPLRFLLADHVDLMKDTNLVAVYADDVFVTVVVEEKNALVGTSRLMIMFDAKDMQLKQWTVTDPQGYDTTVAVYNLDSSKKLNPSMFRIDYTNYHN